MAKLIPGRFSAYELSTIETLNGSVLSYEQKMFLQNCLSQEAVGKSSLEVDTSDMAKFQQSEAYYRGKIEWIEWYLANSEAAEEELLHYHHNNPPEE